MKFVVEFGITRGHENRILKGGAMPNSVAVRRLPTRPKIRCRETRIVLDAHNGRAKTRLRPAAAHTRQLKEPRSGSLLEIEKISPAGTSRK
jgi:hypothetical protein